MEHWQYFKSKPHQLLSKYERWKVITKLLKLSKAAQLRLAWIIFYETKANLNATLVARHFGIARKTFYKWYDRFDESNLRSLEDESRRPQITRRPEYTPLEEQRVIELRLRYPTAGRDKLVVLYAEDFGEPIKLWSMRRIIHDRKLYAKRAVKDRRYLAQPRIVKRKRITDLIKQPFTGFLIEADTIVSYFANERRYVLTAVDYHTRLAFAYMYKTKTAAHAADFLKRLMLLFGGTIRNLHIDNGSEFKREFEQAAHALGIELYHARPYQAQDKPLIERFNGIIQQEYIDLGHFTLDVERFNRNLVDWLIYYNFKRPHHSLGLRRPIEVATLKTQSLQLLPMWSPMTNH